MNNAGRERSQTSWISVVEIKDILCDGKGRIVEEVRIALLVGVPINTS